MAWDNFSSHKLFTGSLQNIGASIYYEGVSTSVYPPIHHFHTFVLQHISTSMQVGTLYRTTLLNNNSKETETVLQFPATFTFAHTFVVPDVVAHTLR